MIDLTDSFPEGVKIFKKDNFRRKPVPENYRCRVKGMLVVMKEGACDKCISGVSQSMLEDQLLHSHKLFYKTLSCGHQSVGIPVISNQAHSAYLYHSRKLRICFSPI